MNRTMDSGGNCSERNGVAPPHEYPTPQLRFDHLLIRSNRATASLGDSSA
jgi:hypothetical protein